MHLTSCNNVRVCYERVLAVSASRGTNEWSECIVTYEGNIKEKNPTRESGHYMGINVQREGSNIIL